MLSLYVAREQNGDLGIYFDKPYRSKSKCWISDYDDHFREIDKNLFPNLKWEDEPILVEFIPKGYLC